MSIMLIMSCYTGFFNVRRVWQSLNTGPRFYLRLIRRKGWLWIYASRTIDGRPFKPKKLSVPFLYPLVPLLCGFCGYSDIFILFLIELNINKQVIAVGDGNNKLSSVLIRCLSADRRKACWFGTKRTLNLTCSRHGIAGQLPIFGVK